ncbi:hypothetical protein JCM10213v2_007219 [Rhodosporidiobolus nylandii]
MGAGLSGMATAIQLRRKLGVEDFLVFEKTDDVGGTWNVNRYPGAACDIPFTFYSFSFDPAYDVPSQWASQGDILKYLHGVQERQKLDKVVFRNVVETSTFSRETGLWTLRVRDLETDTVRTRTCNILLSCLGGLTIPNDPPFDPKDFDGPVFHTAEWRQDVDLKGKDVVVVGNGCTAIQVVPELVKEANTVSQVCRSRQSIFPRIDVPDSNLIRFLLRWLPGFGLFLRCCMYCIIESHFVISDIEKGRRHREHSIVKIKKYIEGVAPKKYWDKLYPDFDVAAKRRIFDTTYYECLNADNMELVADDTVVSAKGSSVFTKNGREIQADAVVLATGFKVRDYFFPMNVVNEKGENLKDRLQQNGVKTFQSTLVSGYPNFWIMGPNGATGHSSVLFTSECQLTLAFHLIRPILDQVRKPKEVTPAPFVEVTQQAEESYWQGLRKEMKKKVWEQDGGVSWYVDPKTGYCTTLYPWSQTHFWRKATFPDYNNFAWTNATRPWAWRSWLGWA